MEPSGRRDLPGLARGPGGGRWLDVGCGTGALSETVLLRAEPGDVSGVDQSEGFVKYARQHLDDPRFDAQVGDARSLPFDDGSFDAVVSGLMLNFIADQGGVANELVRVAAPGATVGVYVWDYAGGMQMMRYFWDAAKDLDPRAREQDEGERFAEIASLKGLGSLFDLAGLGDVRSRSIDIPTIFRDFDDYWGPFLAGQGPAPAYCSSLDDGKRSELRELLRVRLPTKTDGTIRLTARAWAVQGTRTLDTVPSGRRASVKARPLLHYNNALPLLKDPHPGRRNHVEEPPAGTRTLEMHLMERNARSNMRSAAGSGRRLVALAVPVLLLSGLVTLTIAPPVRAHAVRAKLPSISIDDAKVKEGDSGTNKLVFTVTLSKPSVVRVHYRTSGGTATKKDFKAVHGTLRFNRSTVAEDHGEGDRRRAA